MESNKAIKLMKIEQECVRRQKGTDCPRNKYPIYGCNECDLVQDDSDLLEAYDMAVEALFFMQKMCDIMADVIVKAGFDNLDDFIAYLKQKDGDQNEQRFN